LELRFALFCALFCCSAVRHSQARRNRLVSNLLLPQTIPKVNERNKNQNEPTADQQKDNPADRALTQQIRQSLMDDKSLSTYARNVKIITRNGQVTLQGPVRSEAEKQMIEKKATEVAGANKVTSELDVKPQQ
jgi:hypothetical protein